MIREATVKPLHYEEIATVNIPTPTASSYLSMNKVKKFTQRL